MKTNGEAVVENMASIGASRRGLNRAAAGGFAPAASGLLPAWLTQDADEARASECRRPWRSWGRR